MKAKTHNTNPEDVRLTPPVISKLYSLFLYQLLSGLNVMGNHLMVEDYREELMLFTHLSEIELGGCSLGENHEIWTHIGRLPW